MADHTKSHADTRTSQSSNTSSNKVKGLQVIADNTSEYGGHCQWSPNARTHARTHTHKQSFEQSSPPIAVFQFSIIKRSGNSSA